MLDRKIQLKILKELCAVYPDAAIPRQTLYEELGETETIFNLAYLDEHGLTVSRWSRTYDAPPDPVTAKITAKGIDFLEDDGGLSSILGVITIKLHQETITALFIDKIEKSSSSTSVKQQLISKLKGLPADALQKLSLKAIDSGLEKIDVTTWLDKFLNS